MLIIGDAPGKSENATGKPYIGPGGKLITRIVEQANEETQLRIGYTYCIACIPVSRSGSKNYKPPKAAFEACQPRLNELVEMTGAKAFITLGKIAEDHIGTMFGVADDVRMISVTAPYMLLAESKATQDLSMQRVCSQIEDFLTNLKEN